MFPKRSLGTYCFLLCFLLRSSVSDGRPYSDCTVYYYYLFPHFLSGRFLRDDSMDLLEIFREDVTVNGADRFFKKFTSGQKICSFCP